MNKAGCQNRKAGNQNRNKRQRTRSLSSPDSHTPGPMPGPSHAMTATHAFNFLPIHPVKEPSRTPHPLQEAQNRKTMPMKIPPATEAGGANRVRTGDLLLAKQALSQLSYGPARTPEGQHADTRSPSGGPRWTRTTDLTLIRRAL